MKKIILFGLLFFTVFTFSQTKEKVKGSKIVKAEQKQIGHFDSLEVEDNLEIFLVKGNECAIEIEADDNLIEFVDLKILGNNLRISTSKNITSYKKLSIRVTYTDKFNLVSAKDETNVTALSDIVLDNITFKCYNYAKLYLNATTKNFTLMANDKSKVELNLKSVKTAIDLSKNASIKALISTTDMIFDMYQKSSAVIEGDLNDLKIRLDNDSNFEGKKLVAKNITIETSGYSKCEINASTLININAIEKSEINLFGEPKIEIKNFKDTAILKKKVLKP